MIESQSWLWLVSFHCSVLRCFNHLGMIPNQYMKRSIIHLGEILEMAVHMPLCANDWSQNMRKTAWIHSFKDDISYEIWYTIKRALPIIIPSQNLMFASSREKAWCQLSQNFQILPFPVFNKVWRINMFFFYYQIEIGLCVLTNALAQIIHLKHVISAHIGYYAFSPVF